MRRADLESILARRIRRDPILRTACRTARAAGVSIWIVGGMIRDAALGRPTRDLDLVARGRLTKWIPEVRRAFGTGGYRFRKRGVTTWRFRIGGRDLDVVDASRRGIEKDLERRELTINAIAYDPVDRRVLDPLGGLRDLRRGILRLPRPGVVREDAVRALRAARFLADLPGFRLHRDAAREVGAAARALRRASVERVRDEIDRLLGAGSPARGLETLERLGLLGAVLPELEDLPACAAGRDRPDVWSHTLATLEAAARYRRRPGAAALQDPAGVRVLRWSLLFHDVSKPETLRFEAGGRPTFHGHETLGARRADAALRRLRMPRAARRRIVRLIRLHLRPYQIAEAGMPPRGLRRLVRDAGDDLPLLVVHAACDGLGSGAPDARRRWRLLRAAGIRLLEEWERLRQESPEPLVSGTEVMAWAGIGPGPAVGDILERVEQARAEGRISSRSEARDWVRSLRSPAGRDGQGPSLRSSR